MNQKLRLLFLSFFLFQLTLSFSQEQTYIYGKIIDSKTEEPLAFASIAIKNKSVGLISNSDGGFRIPSYFKLVSDTLVVSFIGYHSRNIRISTLDKKQLNIIKLYEKSESLDEVVILAKKLSAKEIVQKAIRNIRTNYPFEDFAYVGYYRDYQKSKEENYLNLNEAILKVYDSGFGHVDYLKTKTKIYEINKNIDFPRDTSASKHYDYEDKTKIIDNAILSELVEGVNEYELLRFHDAIRNYRINSFDFVNVLSKDFVKNHQFKTIKETSLDQVNLYEIQIEKKLDKALVEGKIFISKGDFKIYKLNYSVYKAKVEIIDKFEYGGHTTEKVTKKTELIFNVVIEYEDYQDIMYPKYITFNNVFEVTKPPKFKPLDAKFFHTKSRTGALVVRINLKFNNPLSKKKSSYKERNYKFKYKDNKIDIEKIKVSENTVSIYPTEKSIKFYKTAFNEGQKLDSKAFVIDVKNIEDIHGNEVNVSEQEKFYQFREFFVQELFLEPNSHKKDTFFMKKDVPLFKNKAIKFKKDMSKYWMNTPLKKD